MNERKVVSASHPYYVMDDGTLWRGSIHGVGIGGVQWTRIPGPDGDPTAKAAPRRVFRHQDGRVMRIDAITYVFLPTRRPDHGSRWFVSYLTEDGEDYEGFDTIEDAQVFRDAVIDWMERGS